MVRKDCEWEDIPDQSTRPQDDIPNYAKHWLYHAVVRFASCNCVPQDEDHRYETRLRLRPLLHMAPDNFGLFEMLFSTLPNPWHDILYDWRDIHISFPPRKSSPRVRWTDDIETDEHQQSAGCNANVGANESEKNLCSFTASQRSSVLRFLVNGERLVLQKDEVKHAPPRLHPLSTGPILSLGKVLDKFKMGFGMRPVLAYTVAKAVWHHYDSDWLRLCMTDNHIYFIGEVRDEKVTFFFKPYLLIDLNPADEQIPEYKTQAGLWHRYPRVLTLGIMLAEIATGHRVELDANPNHWTSKVLNELLPQLYNLRQSGNFQKDCDYDLYEQAIQNSLKSSIFNEAPYNTAKPRENREARRAILYKKVVDPLRQLVERTGWAKLLDEFENTALVPQENPVKTASRIDTTISNTQSNQDSDHWLEKTAIVNEYIKDQKQKAGVSATTVKIAILDTGYDANAPSLLDIPGAARRIHWKDFVSSKPGLPSPKPVDQDGHGTHLLTVILQMQCLADIYVARVSETSFDLGPMARANIVKAIKFAAEEWKVDFVSLSLGFPRHVREIRVAIEDAVYHRKQKNEAITFFAAANNNGLNGAEMFPANMGGDVLAIRGTNIHGGFESKYNPERSSRELPVFGTLACDVYSDWTGTDERRSMSGCSVATPIAVALASMVVDYAASKPAEFSPDDLRLMRTRIGVSELFKGKYSSR